MLCSIKRKNFAYLIEEKDLNDKLLYLIKEIYEDNSKLENLKKNLNQYSDENVYTNINEQLKKIFNEKINLGQKEIIHFVGIGGIGMSGLAQIMKNMGFKVQGSDQNKIKILLLVKKQVLKFLLVIRKKILEVQQF